MSFKTLDEVRAWHEKIVADWHDLHATHDRERQAHEAIAFLLNGPDTPSMEGGMCSRVVHELNMRDALERY